MGRPRRVLFRWLIAKELGERLSISRSRAGRGVERIVTTVFVWTWTIYVSSNTRVRDQRVIPRSRLDVFMGCFTACVHSEINKVTRENAVRHAAARRPSFSRRRRQQQQRSMDFIKSFANAFTRRGSQRDNNTITARRILLRICRAQ